MMNTTTTNENAISGSTIIWGVAIGLGLVALVVVSALI